MNRGFIFISVFVLSTVITSYSYVQGSEEHIVRGNVVCVEMDPSGKAIVSQDFTECKGVVYMLSVDGRIASIHGSKQEMQKLSKSSKTRMGYRLPLRLKGSDSGHQRAWMLNMESLEPIESGGSERISVTGTLYCIFPNHKEGNVNPEIAACPCDGYMNHAHVIYTKDGRTLAVHGTHEKISELEQTSKRENATLSGSLYGNSGGWILYVD